MDSDCTPRSLKSKLVVLGQEHYPSEKYFPLPGIIKLLEQLGCQKNWNVRFVYRTMREIGVSFVDLLPLYDHLFKAKVSMYQYLEPLYVVYKYINHIVAYFQEFLLLRHDQNLKICSKISSTM